MRNNQKPPVPMHPHIAIRLTCTQRKGPNAKLHVCRSIATAATLSFSNTAHPFPCFGRKLS